MASIQSLGVGSGLLTSELVEDIIAAEREATDLRLDSRRAEIDAKISAFGGVKSSLAALQSAAEVLGSSDGFISYTTASSNPAAFTASSSAEATPGVHTVEVQALARAHTLATAAYDDLDSVVGDGTLTIRFGTTTFSGGNYDSFTADEAAPTLNIEIDENNNTLTGVRDAINAAQTDVIASVVNDGSGYVLVLTSAQTGAERSMEIQVAEGTTPGLSALAFNSSANTPGTNLTQTVAADDAVVTVNGISVTRDSNELNEVIPGITINALGLNAGAPATLSVTRDVEDIETRLQAFVDAFNDTKALADELTEFDAESGSGSLLTGDATLRSVRTQMRRFIGGAVANLESTTIRTLADLGIRTNQNADFFLEFDAQEFRDAMSAAPEDVAALLADASRASDPQIEVLSFQPATEAGDYAVEIERAATAGFVTGGVAAGLAGTVTIDADNDQFGVSIDGSATLLVDLVAGTYSGDELAAHLEAQVNGNPARVDATPIAVSFDAAENQLTLRSGTFGTDSSIAITSVDTNVTADFGLAVDDGEATRGLEALGTINGVQAVASGQFLSVPLGPVPAASARLYGDALTAFPVVIDGSNQQLQLRYDNISSDPINLTVGSYDDGFALAEELETQINADAKISAAGGSLRVEYDIGQDRLVFTSDSTGSSAVLEVLDLAGDLNNLLGLAVGASAQGDNGSERPDAAAGLQVRVSGDTTGSRGTVTLVRGVMNELARFLDNALGIDGSVDNKISLFEERLDEIDAEAADFSRKMQSLEDRLRFQFAAADALISQFNNTSSFLTQQLANLPGFAERDS